jgi:putative flippase GtrA
LRTSWAKVLRSVPLRYRQLLQQLLSFGIVGILATFTNAVLYHFLMLSGLFSSLVSNFYAFCIAFLVTLGGQFYWTFDAERRTLDNPKRALFRFLQVSLLGLCVNSALAFFLVDQMQFPHEYYIVAMLFFTPLLLFYLNKIWVFKT